MRKFDKRVHATIRTIAAVIATICFIFIVAEAQDAKSIAYRAGEVMTTVSQTMTFSDKVSQTNGSHKVVEARPTTNKPYSVPTTTLGTTISKDTFDYKYTTVDLNCRKSPNTNSKILGVFNYNTKLKVYSTKEGWSYVEAKCSSGKNIEGYVYTKYLSNKKQPKRTEPTFSKTELKIGSGERKVYIGTFKLTFYCHCSQCCGKSDGITASGARVQEGVTIAVNPSEIPLGTSVYIEGFGKRIAQDTGGFGSNTIDVYVSSHSRAYELGVQYKKVYKLV